MTLKQRAVLDVLKVLGLGVILGTVITLAVDWVGLAAVALAVSVTALAWLAKMAYDIRVSQLEHEAERVRRALKD